MFQIVCLLNCIFRIWQEINMSDNVLELTDHIAVHFCLVSYYRPLPQWPAPGEVQALSVCQCL